MKRWGTIGILVIVLVLTGLTGCTGMEEQDSAPRVVEVVKDDLLVSISGNGNVTLVNERSLAFSIGGTVEEINVEEGDRVSTGQVLATLNKDDLEMSVAQAEAAYEQAKVAKSQAELALSQAELSHSQAELNLKQLGVTESQAEAALELAQWDLDRMEDVQEIKDKIEEAEWELKFAEMMLTEARKAQDTDAINYWRGVIAGSPPWNLPAAKSKITELQADLAELRTKSEYVTLQENELSIKVLQVDAAKQTLEQAKRSRQAATQAIKHAAQNVEYAKVSIDYTEKAIGLAEHSLEHAKKQLDKTVMTAPISGIAISVNVKEGDTIPAATFSTQPIIHIIDTTNLELVVEVDEIDVPKIRLGQKAVISFDALPDALYDGELTDISYTPTVEAGVILYEVKVGFKAPADSGVKIGMSVTADIVLDERNDVLLVPNRAVTEDKEGNTIVMVVLEDDKTEERPVTVGVSDDFNTEITSGLQAGEKVLIEPRTTKSAGGFF